MKLPRAKDQLTALILSLLLAGSCDRALADDAERARHNQAWAERVTGLLKPTPSQQSALRAYVAALSEPSKAGHASQAQLNAMTLVERTDYFAQQTAAYHQTDQAAAAALHRFYDSLTPEQRQAFDKDTAWRAPPATVAADVISIDHPETPNLRLPAHTDASWLIKPTAENIARVYPSEASRQHISGKVTLSCIADEDGYLADCIVDSEAPTGMGFGNAALEITAYMRMQPAANYGVPVKGTVRVPITFALPEAE
jgi:TonB family protein